MKLFFFGVKNPENLGHFLYDQNGQRVRCEEAKLPFRQEVLDSGLLREPEQQGRLHLAIINGWTVLGMWDRTGDKRGNSNASFIAEGAHTTEEMKAIAAEHFPALWARIQKTNI